MIIHVHPATCFSFYEKTWVIPSLFYIFILWPSIFWLLLIDSQNRVLLDPYLGAAVQWSKMENHLKRQTYMSPLIFLEPFNRHRCYFQIFKSSPNKENHSSFLHSVFGHAWYLSPRVSCKVFFPASKLSSSAERASSLSLQPDGKNAANPAKVLGLLWALSSIMLHGR